MDLELLSEVSKRAVRLNMMLNQHVDVSQLIRGQHEGIVQLLLCLPHNVVQRNEARSPHGGLETVSVNRNETRVLLCPQYIYVSRRSASAIRVPDSVVVVCLTERIQPLLHESDEREKTRWRFGHKQPEHRTRRKQNPI